MSVAFPTERDVPNLSREDAQRALRALRKFDLAGVAEVYDFRRPDRSHEWVVWLPITRRRMTLQKWAAQWLAEQQDAHRTTTPPPRFTVGQLVRWPQGRCIFRIAGPPSRDDSSVPPVRWYGGLIVSGENAGSYALSVPEEQLEPVTPGTPEGPEGPGGDAA